SGGPVPGILDGRALAAYAARLAKAAGRLGLRTDFSPSDLLALPGVIRKAGELELSERLWPAAERAISGALRAMDGMRRTEGRALASAMRKYLKAIRRLAAGIKPLAGDSVRRHVERMRSRVDVLLAESPGGGDLTREAIEREIALYADRADVSEELDRLDSHIGQFEAALAKGGEAGKRLDFWCQEMFREINTIGSKALDERITRRVVEMKNLVEKIREQAQNIE
ncbi:MAG: DUF1732 domain-containing protein, partial [Planctomycetota bacterium]|nr:DUF1732 domain-containing protein [Planctomycetota bacterium]